ncbi:GNAT family N-acetyltransferase [Kitasatospora sp. NA04385]|uniref:GNAT family N-acetyltransferase n=1 Tax=Kitasatospora sp. NA04385 TaxID=2742135 RepID=UPI0020CAD674|nr:GNAT family N-acetyltransferase [Kitasatospora sp. NA04385]
MRATRTPPPTAPTLPRTVPELPAAHGYRLRRWGPEDTGLLREVAADPYVPLVTTVPAPYTEAGAAAYLESQRRRTEIGTGYPFVIVDPTGRPVGDVGLWVGELPLRGRATVGYWVAASARRRGAATAALGAVADWALDELALPGLELHVEPWNTGSIRTAERAGFRPTGLRTTHRSADGRPRDTRHYVRP